MDRETMSGSLPATEKWPRRCGASGGVAALLWASAVLSGIAEADVLDDYLALVTGSFDSSAQASRDVRYDEVVWHTVPIWSGDPDTRWTYTENWLVGMDQPYRQRINRYWLTGDGSILVDSYPVPEAPDHVGAWRDPSRFRDLDPDQLPEAIDCTARLVRTGPRRFEGGTVGQTCRNSFQGAAYLVSYSRTDPQGVQNWDRGFNQEGEQVWGPVAGPYRFQRQGTSGCTEPVLMLVHGEIFDRQAFGAYVSALAESGLYPAHQGYYRAISPASEVFEGDVPSERGVVLARFPCLAAARRFWNSSEYQQVKALRRGAARFEVSVFTELAVPDYVAW